MSIERLGNGKWRVRVRSKRDPKTGKVKNLSRIVSGPKSAALAVEVELKGGTGAKAAKVTLGEVASDWLESRPLEKNTIRFYERGLEDLGAMTGYIISSIDHNDITDALESISPGYGRRRARKTISAVMGYAHKRGIIDANPMSKVDVKDKVPAPKRDRYSKEEVAQILTLFRDDPIEGVVILMCCCGVRRSEAVCLEWGDIDFERGYIRIDKAMVDLDSEVEVKSPKTVGSIRDVPLRGYALERLGELRGEGRICQMEPRSVSRRFKRVIERSGMRYIRLYNLRHSFTSQAIDQGASHLGLQKVLGHTRFSTTANYAVQLRDGADEVVESVAESFRPA